MKSWIFSFLITTLTTSFAYADIRPYALEVLVFSRPEPVQSITEIFPVTEPEEPQNFDLQFALDSGFNNLKPLPESSHILRNSALRIQTQLKGQVLFHERWIHPLTKKQLLNPWFRISGMGEDGFSLKGYLRWSIDRFIEVDTDLRVTRTGIRQAPDGTLIDEVYVLREFRKISSKDIHYLDHPAFGVIIAAEPIELAEPQAQPANVASELETPPLPQAR